MQHVEKTSDHLGIPGVLSMVFRKLAGRTVEWPGFGDFDIGQFDDDVARSHTGEVVGQMGAYPE